MANLKIRGIHVYRTKDFAYVCPEFLRWADSRKNMIRTNINMDASGDTYVPDGAVHRRYSYDDQQWYYEMPLTYFVTLSR